jgi:2-phosphosulfolactate phosphatase
MTKFHYYSLAEASNTHGVVVVIDVLRAFTTAAYALANGVCPICPVGEVEEALHYKRENEAYLLMGEVDGYKPPSFDFSNSPDEICHADLSGKTLIHRSSAGTQGLILAENAVQLLAASFVVAGATASFIRELNPDDVAFVVTGTYRGRDGDEDRCCGEYIETLVRGQDVDSKPFLDRIGTSTVGKHFLQGKAAYILKKDYELSLRVNTFHFCLPVHREGVDWSWKKEIVYNSPSGE